jgi:hypothetical protein
MALDPSLLKVGSKLKDNDVRFPDRVVTVTALLPNGVKVYNPATDRETRIQSKFLHTDGKPRRYGYALLA